MKEFILTQSYGSIEEMLNSVEVAIYKEELQQGNIEKYAVVSRVGNRYDIDGNKIEDFVDNPFVGTVEKAPLPYVVEAVEEKMEEKEMKYPEVEAFIDGVVEKQIEDVKRAYEEEITRLKVEHAQEIAELKRVHEDELATAKENAKAEAREELLAKLNA